MLDMIFLQIAEERARQDEQWGGPRHDDGHDALEWLEIIRQHAMRAAKAGAGIGQPRDLAAARQHYIKVAAVAVAAIEALDRYAEEHEPALTDAIGTTCSACGGSGLLATPIELLGDPLECPACAGTGIRQNDWQESDTKGAW